MNINNKDTEITLSLLQSIAEKSDVTQRSLSQRLGLALGLTNNYLKHCVKDGLIKIEQVPANRYLYYLTPKGFAKKSRLMATYLNHSMKMFREARAECIDFFAYCIENKYSQIAVLGNNDLSELASLIARSYDLDVSITSISKIKESVFDCWIITDAQDAQEIYETLSVFADKQRIFCFSALKIIHPVAEGQR